MLTKTDLSEIQKIITVTAKKIVREEIEAEGKNTRDELKGDLITSRMRIQQEIRDLADRIKNLEIRVNNSANNSNKGFKNLDKRFTRLFDFLDKDQLKTAKRVERIEVHLKLPPIQSQI
ncbi:MAG: hypothetical protein AAB875_06875 [Patescibacteria group bacterium]